MATCVISATSTNLPPASMISLQDKKQQRSSEARLVQRAQSGDEQAFATLYETHKKRVYSVCLQMTRDIADAEDLTQEAFLQVFRCIHSFRGDSAFFSTWLYRIAVNTVLMKLRRRKAPPLVSLDEPVSTDSTSLKREIGEADLRLSGTIDRIALCRAVEKLPSGCRQIFDLHEVQGFQHHEIARRLQCSIGNSKSQLHKAKVKMRGVLFPKKGISRLKTDVAAGNMARSLADNGAPGLSYTVL
ncbi:MAG: sigma-70 family RNA polymerase sigma factor [Terriglobales bacterium]